MASELEDATDFSPVSITAHQIAVCISIDIAAEPPEDVKGQLLEENAFSFITRFLLVEVRAARAKLPTLTETVERMVQYVSAK